MSVARPPSMKPGLSPTSFDRGPQPVFTSYLEQSRIGHLGDMTEVMVLLGLATAETAMADLDYPIESGAGVAAAQCYYADRSNDSAQEVV